MVENLCADAGVYFERLGKLDVIATAHMLFFVLLYRQKSKSLHSFTRDEDKAKHAIQSAIDMIIHVLSCDSDEEWRFWLRLGGSAIHFYSLQVLLVLETRYVRDLTLRVQKWFRYTTPVLFTKPLTTTTTTTNNVSRDASENTRVLFEDLPASKNGSDMTPSVTFDVEKSGHTESKPSENESTVLSSESMPVTRSPDRKSIYLLRESSGGGGIKEGLAAAASSQTTPLALGLSCNLIMGRAWFTLVKVLLGMC